MSRPPTSVEKTGTPRVDDVALDRWSKVPPEAFGRGVWDVGESLPPDPVKGVPCTSGTVSTLEYGRPDSYRLPRRYH